MVMVMVMVAASSMTESVCECECDLVCVDKSIDGRTVGDRSVVVGEGFVRRRVCSSPLLEGEGEYHRMC